MNIKSLKQKSSLNIGKVHSRKSKAKKSKVSKRTIQKKINKRENLNVKKKRWRSKKKKKNHFTRKKYGGETQLDHLKTMQSVIKNIIDLCDKDATDDAPIDDYYKARISYLINQIGTINKENKEETSVNFGYTFDNFYKKVLDLWKKNENITCNLIRTTFPTDSQQQNRIQDTPTRAPAAAPAAPATPVAPAKQIQVTNSVLQSINEDEPLQSINEEEPLNESFNRLTDVWKLMTEEERLASIKRELYTMLQKYYVDNVKTGFTPEQQFQLHQQLESLGTAIFNMPREQPLQREILIIFELTLNNSDILNNRSDRVNIFNSKIPNFMNSFKENWLSIYKKKKKNRWSSFKFCPDEISEIINKIILILLNMTESMQQEARRAAEAKEEEARRAAEALEDDFTAIAKGIKVSLDSEDKIKSLKVDIKPLINKLEDLIKKNTMSSKLISIYNALKWFKNNSSKEEEEKVEVGVGEVFNTINQFLDKSIHEYSSDEEKAEAVKKAKAEAVRKAARLLNVKLIIDATETKAPAATPASASAASAASATTNYYSLDTLQNGCPDGVVPTNKPMYLSDSEFEKVFGMNKDAYGKLAKWKQTNLKKKHGLF